MGRSRRHGGKQVYPREDVIVARRERRDLESGRDQDRSAEPDPRALLEYPHQAADAVPAVALAGDEDGRTPPIVPRQPAGHELAQRLEVALEAEVLLRVVRF